MRIVIPVTGSHGDIRPYVALGRGLQAVGHKVRVATHADFAALVRGQGLDFTAIADSARAWHESETGKQMFNAGRNALAFMRAYARLREPHLRDLMVRSLHACRDADLVVISTTAVILCHCVAEKLALPTLPAYLVPTTPTALLANCLFPEAPPWLPARRLYNRLSHLFVGECLWQLQRACVNQVRREVLDLPPLPFLGPTGRFSQSSAILYGYSPLVLPRPRDWDERHHLTGYWCLDTSSSWRPPAELLRFLRAGPPPVCIGFSSMHNQEAERTTDMVLRALARTGQRAILLTGWGGLNAVRGSERLFVAEAVPHDWLFPRVAAVVHHGGAGTTAAALRAGRPSLVVPFAADQYFWGRRVFTLGVGPRPIPRPRLTGERLVGALQQIASDPELRSRAAWLGEQLRAEDGVRRAVDVFQRHVEAAERCVPVYAPPRPRRRVSLPLATP